jgi:hypothetical protein
VRLQLDYRWLLAEWKPAYKRGYIMQASLVVVGGALGLARCRQLAHKRLIDSEWKVVGLLG